MVNLPATVLTGITNHLGGHTDIEYYPIVLGTSDNASFLVNRRRVSAVCGNVKTTGRPLPTAYQVNYVVKSVTVHDASANQRTDYDWKQHTSKTCAHRSM